MRRLLLVVTLLLAASSASARNGGLYLELAPAYGFFLTDEVIIENGDDDGAVFPQAGFVPQLKLGFNLFGYLGAELDVAAHGWDLGAPEIGGGGFVGGVVRATPLELLRWVVPEDVRFPNLLGEPVSWHDRFFDVGVYVGGGYTMVGEDFAYQGGYVKWGFDLKWFITPNFAVGIDLPFRHPLYEPFRYTNYSKGKGLCTDGEDAFGLGGIPIPPVPREAYTPLELDAADIETECDGAPPSAVFFAPAFTISGVIDFGI